jgi:glucose-1-phosphate adenylyltransferase
MTKQGDPTEPGDAIHGHMAFAPEAEPRAPPSDAGSAHLPQLTRSTVAMVLAGGRGTRLGPLTDWRAKPAVPFGGKFRIIDFALSNCVNSGVRRIGILTQYKAQSLIRHVQNGWGFLDGRLGEFVELMPAQQRVWTEWYRGTADAVFQNLDILRRLDPRYVLVLAGDHVYKMDYAKLLADHVRRGADMTVPCVEVPLEQGSAFGIMGVDQALQVRTFQEKPQVPTPIQGRSDVALASMGIYVFNAPFLYEALIRDADDPRSSHDFGKDLIPRLIASGYRVFAHRFAESCVNMSEGRPYWRDVGTVDAYWEANMELVKVTPDLNLYDRDWPIWTFQMQLPPAKFVFDDDGRRGMAVDSMVSGGCLISGSALRRSLLFSDVHVHSYCTIEDAVVLPNVDIGRHCVLKRVVIDKYCRLPPEMKIGVDPVADRRRFHVTDKGVVLVTPEMLGQQVHHAR